MGFTYSDGRAEWDVERLWALAQDLHVTLMQHTDFREWYEYGWEAELTLRGVVDHMRRVLEADLSYPIILSAEGNIMDGCHRLARAGLEGVPVRMVRFQKTPAPDRFLDNPRKDTMPRIVSPPEPKHVKCGDCRATIEYMPEEVEERHGTDYGGGPDGWKRIKCPRPGCPGHGYIERR